MPETIQQIIDREAAKTSSTDHRKPTQSMTDHAAFVGSRIATDRGAFGWIGYKPLREIARVAVLETSEKVAIEKPTQRGFTTWGFGYSLWQAERNGRNSLYFLPTNDLAKDVARNRFAPAVGGGDLDEPMQGRTSGIVHRTPNGRTIYFLGLDTVRNAISRPADICVWDEVDDLDPENMELSRQRLDASPYAHELAFCCGRYPEEGIDAMYLAGDRRRWIVRCKACGAEHIPEERFPANFGRTDAGWITICPACGRPMDFESCGQFVAEAPSVKGRISFRVSALAFGCTNPDRIMAEWTDAQGDRRKIAAFRSSKLATPDGGDRQSLSASDVARVLAPCPASGPLKYVGVDTGDWCHVAVCGASSGGPGYGFGEFWRVRGEELIACLQGIAGRHGIDGILVDQRPEGSLARAVCRAFPGVAWLQSFRRVDQKEDEKELAGEVFPTMIFEREEALEHFCDEVKGGRIWFPESWQETPFLKSEPCRHIITGSGKEEVRTAHDKTVLAFRGGSVANHWMMASVFATTIARRQMGREVAIHEVHVSERTRVTRELGIGGRIMARMRGGDQ